MTARVESEVRGPLRHPGARHRRGPDRRRLLAAAGLAGALALGAAGCGEGSRATAVSPGSRHAISGRVVQIMNGSGLPLQNDYIGCLPGADRRSDTCLGLTADEPVQKVQGLFVASGDGTGAGCAGTLTVTVGPTSGNPFDHGSVDTVEKVPEDPCR